MNNLQIFCNGQPRRVAAGTSVLALIRELRLEAGQVAVELDGRVLEPSEIEQAVLTNGARLELIRFVGGG